MLMLPGLAGRMRAPRRLGLRLEGRTAHLVLLALLGVSFLVRALLASTTVTPVYPVDELIHGELARNVAAGGWLRMRGESIFVSYAYPAAIAPAWLADSVERSYELAKLLNAALMSLAAVPVYLWARRLCGDRGGLIAAALTLCLPWFALTATLMSANLLFPLFLLALYAAARAIEEPGPGWVGLFLVALVAATLTHVQALVLIPILVTSAVAGAIVSRRPVQLRPYTPVGAGLVATAAVYVAVKLATGGSLTRLGVYEGVRDADYSVGAQLGWLVDNLGTLVLATGVAPAVALLAVAIGRPRRPDHRAFVAVAFSTVVWLVALTAFASAWEPVGVKERYLFYAAPVLLIALALWIERELGASPWGVAVAGVAVVVLVAALPLKRLLAEPGIVGNAFGLVFVRRLSEWVAGGIGTTRVLLGVGAIVAAAAVAVVPRGYRALVAAAVGAFLVVSSVPVVRTLGDESRRARDLARLPKNADWMDAAIGSGSRALFLNTAEFEPETRHGSVRRQFTSVWETEFWNRSFRDVVSFGTREPAPLPQRSTTLDWATGSIVGVEAEFILARPRFPVDGRLLARAGDLQLWRVGGAVRLTAATEGVFANGRAGQLSAYSRWAEGPGRVKVLVSRGPARVRIGALGASAAGRGEIVLVTGRGAVRARAGGQVAFEAPPAPFRIEVRGVRGARVAFRLFRG